MRYPIIGTFNFDAGILSIAGGQPYALRVPDSVYDEEGNKVIGDDGQPVMTSFMAVFMTNSSDGTAPVALSMPESGTLTSPSMMFGIYGVWEDETNGWYDLFKAFDALKVVTPPENPAVMRQSRRTL